MNLFSIEYSQSINHGQPEIKIFQVWKITETARADRNLPREIIVIDLPYHGNSSDQRVNILDVNTGGRKVLSRSEFYNKYDYVGYISEITVEKD